MSATSPSRAPRRRMAVAGAAALTALLSLYLWVVATRAVALLRTGEPVGIGLGLGILVLPLLAIWAIAREWRMAFMVQRMADELAAAGRLPVDDLPRSPGGRIDREAATEAFAIARAEAEAAPEDWAAWYRLAFAYDAAGDRRRAREALRTAARLHRG
ncbi:hypothetical protein [Cellulomonas chengniuliangii]|uniref:Tetratricopeptide repeat protein n=1 Tax=Cellulomonas chengniuliangii TaxID=2968084 RepID=A0ABY5KUQ7_9CELL|nr:hypothetical protein [Cellulomonas chengniuliangii]MCC2309098.1 hypothetical protein [Cellulomonas chengniuliangii]MCC2319241.1 hypothetical protein [Cellulomonas chengniuliangii]UUI74180.1 hypothetical protein NP064_10135 [Cellulomonas chengniuliangii]